MQAAAAAGAQAACFAEAAKAVKATPAAQGRTKRLPATPLASLVHQEQASSKRSKIALDWARWGMSSSAKEPEEEGIAGTEESNMLNAFFGNAGGVCGGKLFASESNVPAAAAPVTLAGHHAGDRCGGQVMHPRAGDVVIHKGCPATVVSSAVGCAARPPHVVVRTEAWSPEQVCISALSTLEDVEVEGDANPSASDRPGVLQPGCQALLRQGAPAMDSPHVDGQELGAESSLPMHLADHEAALDPLKVEESTLGNRVHEVAPEAVSSSFSTPGHAPTQSEAPPITAGNTRANCYRATKGTKFTKTSECIY